MKRLVSVALVVTFVTLSILPLLALAAIISGYSFNFTALGACEAVICVITVAASVIALKAKDIKLGAGYQILCGLMFPVGLASILCLMYHSPAIYSVFAIPCIIGCTAIYVYKFLRVKILKFLILGVCFILFMLLCLGLMIRSEFGSFGSRKTIKTELSPDGKYYADVVSQDEGGLGGTTVIFLREVGSEHDFGIVKYYKEPERVYDGEYSEAFEEFSIEWEEKDGRLIPKLNVITE